MHCSLAFLFVLCLAVSCQLAQGTNLEPTPAPPAPEKRQSSGSSIDLSPLLSNPAAALQQASSLLAQPEVSAALRSIVTNSFYQSQISAAFESQLGPQTASLALASYSQLVASIIGQPTQSIRSSGVAQTTAPTPTVQSSGGSGGSSGSNNSGPSNSSVTLSSDKVFVSIFIVVVAFLMSIV